MTKCKFEEDMSNELRNAYAKFLKVESLINTEMGSDEGIGHLCDGWVIIDSSHSYADAFTMFSCLCKCDANQYIYVFKTNVENSLFVFFGSDEKDIIKSISNASARAIKAFVGDYDFYSV